MKPQIHRIIKLTETQLILKLHTAALMYSIYADTTLLFIFSKGKESPYGTYEATFYQYNFMHLAGIKSQTMSAQKFYEACLSGTIKKEDCSPTHSLNNMYEKISVINNLLDFKHSKCYRIGEKNLITKDNDFELATGNSSGVIGYDHKKDAFFKIDFDEIPVRFPGTGDIFSAVLIGMIMSGNDLYKATEKAMQVVYDMIKMNLNNVDKYKGIPIETCLEVID